MFNKPFEKRLASWKEFREMLEESEDPLREALEFYTTAPKVNIQADPWDQATWPSPWELVEWNEYCPFTTVLGVCYSLQLTDRFKDSEFEIHIGIDKNKAETCYFLRVDKDVIGWDFSYESVRKIPRSFSPQMVYPMPGRH